MCSGPVALFSMSVLLRLDAVASDEPGRYGLVGMAAGGADFLRADLGWEPDCSGASSSLSELSDSGSSC